MRFTVGEFNYPLVGLEYTDTLTFTITPHYTPVMVQNAEQIEDTEQVEHVEQVERVNWFKKPDKHKSKHKFN